MLVTGTLVWEFEVEDEHVDPNWRQDILELQVRGDLTSHGDMLCEVFNGLNDVSNARSRVTVSVDRSR